jgi:hypothetical protein
LVGDNGADVLLDAFGVASVWEDELVDESVYRPRGKEAGGSEWLSDERKGRMVGEKMEERNTNEVSCISESYFCWSV